MKLRHFLYFAEVAIRTNFTKAAESIGITQPSSSPVGMPTDSTLTSTSTRQPWVSYLSIIACLGIFLSLGMEKGNPSWETLAKFGYMPADLIWDGGYWTLITSVFVHLTFWHVAFNVYWLWVLGSRLERAIGSVYFLVFFVVSAFVSSSFQLAASDDTGIGASGVVYAIFGFMWLTRHIYPHFNEALDTRTIRIILIWLVGCIVATLLHVWEVGNAAHISGLLFGAAVAGAFVLHSHRGLILGGLVALVLLSTVPLFWCPWSVPWLRHQAYAAHNNEQYEAAVKLYDQVIYRDPDDSWAYLNRSYAYQSLGQSNRAESDFQKARELDPSIEENN